MGTSLDGIISAAVESRLFLKADKDGKFSLYVTHSYQYQVQAQLKFRSANYCDFTV